MKRPAEIAQLKRIQVRVVALVAMSAVVILAIGQNPPFRSFSSEASRQKSTKKRRRLPHDDSKHPWHWTRSHGLPSATLGAKRDCNGTSYAKHYRFFHTHGYTIFDSCSLRAANDTILRPASEYTASLNVSRKGNAKNTATRLIATDPDTRELIEYIHGNKHRAFPFQTLNFPTPTEQPLHSDLIHFDTLPRMMMTAAWVALEDVGSDNGPLAVVPGSHLRGTWDFDEIGLRNKTNEDVKDHHVFNDLYGEELNRLVEEDPDLFVEHASSMKFGQTLIWAAGLLHGGAPKLRATATRRSQVTHYFFEGAKSYWVPRLSDPSHGNIQFIESISSCRSRQNKCADARIQRWLAEDSLL